MALSGRALLSALEELEARLSGESPPANSATAFAPAPRPHLCRPRPASPKEPGFGRLRPDVGATRCGRTSSGGRIPCLPATPLVGCLQAPQQGIKPGKLVIPKPETQGLRRGSARLTWGREDAVGSQSRHARGRFLKQLPQTRANSHFLSSSSGPPELRARPSPIGQRS